MDNLNSNSMRKFIGTKQVMAKECDLGEFKEMTGRDPYAGNTSKVVKPHVPSEEGYLVQYEDGYLSWSPKAVFDKAYKPFGTPEEELINEISVTRKKLHKLCDFIYSDKFEALDHSKKRYFTYLRSNLEDVYSHLQEYFNLNEKKLPMNSCEDCCRSDR